MLRQLLSLIIVLAASVMAASFRTIDKGQNSGFDGTATVVYRTRGDFESFWRRHGSNRIPVPDVPEVDFASEMVVVVFSGTKNTGGYNVEITSVDQRENEIIVNYVTDSPPPGAITTQALTQPYHMIAIDASDKEVVFEGAAKAARPPFPKFILTFEEGYDTGAIVEQINTHPAIENVKTLFSGKIAFVDFDPEQVSEDEARAFLRGIAGVKTIEEEYS
jgi:hypothetical protein